MDVREYKKVVNAQVEEHLLKKADRIVDDITDNHSEMTHERVRCLKDIYKALWYMKQYCKEP